MVQSNIFAVFCYTWADNDIFRIFGSLQLLTLIRNCELVAWCLLYRCSLKKVWNLIIQLQEYAIPLLILLCHQKYETCDWLQELMVSSVQTIIYVGHTVWAPRRGWKNEVKRLEGPSARSRGPVGPQTFNTWYLSFLVRQHQFKAWKWYAKKWHFGGCFHHLGWSSWWCHQLDHDDAGVGTIYWVVGSSKFPFTLQMVGDAFKVMHCNKDPLLKLTKFNWADHKNPYKGSVVSMLILWI